MLLGKWSYSKKCNTKAGIKWKGNLSTSLFLASEQAHRGTWVASFIMVGLLGLRARHRGAERESVKTENNWLPTLNQMYNKPLGKFCSSPYTNPKDLVSPKHY